jgi:hypothetical protein
MKLGQLKKLQEAEKDTEVADIFLPLLPIEPSLPSAKNTAL